MKRQEKRAMSTSVHIRVSHSLTIDTPGRVECVSAMSHATRECMNSKKQILINKGREGKWERNGGGLERTGLLIINYSTENMES